MLKFNTTLKRFHLIYSVKTTEEDFSTCIVRRNKAIMLLLSRNQKIKDIAIMRIHRFWRDVSCNPKYAFARKRLCEGLEDPDLVPQENSKKRSLESSDSPKSKKPRIRNSSS